MLSKIRGLKMKQKPVFMLVCWLAICMTMQFASAQGDVASTERVSVDSNGNQANDSSGTDRSKMLCMRYNQFL